jgi:hypothetical protein
MLLGMVSLLFLNTPAEIVPKENHITMVRSLPTLSDKDQQNIPVIGAMRDAVPSLTSASQLFAVGWCLYDRGYSKVC